MQLQCIGRVVQNRAQQTGPLGRQWQNHMKTTYVVSKMIEFKFVGGM